MNVLEIKRVKNLKPGQTVAIAKPNDKGQLMAHRTKDGLYLTVYRQLPSVGIELVRTIKFS